MIELSAVRTRRRLTVAEKLEVINFARTNSVTAAHERFHVSRSSIREWCTRADELTRSPSTSLRVNHAAIDRDRPVISGDPAMMIGQMTQESACSQPSHATATNSIATVDDAAGVMACTNPADTANAPFDVEERSENEDDQHVNTVPSTPPTTRGADEANTFVLIGYIGAEGGFADLAVRRTFSKLLADGLLTSPVFEVTGYHQVTSMLEAMHQGEIDYAFVEASTLLSTTHRLHLERFVELRLHIVGQVESIESVSVCALPGTELSEVDCVASDWLHLQRHEEFILGLETQNRTQIHRQVTWDSVLACELIAEEQAENTLVLCNKQTAIAKGLRVLVDNLVSTAGHTRYMIIGREDTPSLPFESTSHDTEFPARERTSTLLLCTRGRGGLLDVISAFAYRGVNVEYLCMQREPDDLMRQSCIITYQTSQSTIVEGGLQIHLVAAAQQVTHLGNYGTLKL